ncbi:isoflavone reductase [Metarhizium guizhouense ARSEF 977]|uniref:Isoflavone reductase n=1 Tax=Metarhizium guizhouense (strain ARSEF 977) TaxID=1276136 RepID=A0A0B4GZE4_METGA|nr:isoflavone reductase [Metarhizium guizhouense ARSEF 977]
MQLSQANLAALNRLHQGQATAPTMDSVLVIGAGELGLCVLQALAAHPKRHHVKVSVLMRQATLDSAAPAKKRIVQRIKNLNVHFESADVVLAGVQELAGIFTNYHTVVSCSGMELPGGTQTKLAEAALRARLLVRRMLRAQSETGWVIVSTGLFMSFLFAEDFGVVDLRRGVVRALGSWDNRITLTAAPDIGRVTAEVVLDPRGVGNEVVLTAGDTVSYGQLADLLDEHFGTRFARELWDVDTLRGQMAEDPSALVKYRDVFARGRGVSWDKDRTLNFARGMELLDVKGYLDSVNFKAGEA